jgi:hypothetical protein
MWTIQARHNVIQSAYSLNEKYRTQSQCNVLRTHYIHFDSLWMWLFYFWKVWYVHYRERKPLHCKHGFIIRMFSITEFYCISRWCLYTVLTCAGVSDVSIWCLYTVLTCAGVCDVSIWCLYTDLCWSLWRIYLMSIYWPVLELVTYLSDDFTVDFMQPQ